MNRVNATWVHRTARALVVGVLLALCQSHGSAQTPPAQYEPSAPAVSSSSAPGFLRTDEAATQGTAPGLDLTRAVVNTVVALLVVLALVLGLAYLLRRASVHIRQIGGGGIAVLAQVPLGPSQFLSVVDIGGEVIVLGVTEHSVTALSEIEDQNLIAKLRQDRNTKGQSSQLLQGLPSFKQWLQRAQRGDGG